MSESNINFEIELLKILMNHLTFEIFLIEPKDKKIKYNFEIYYYN